MADSPQPEKDNVSLADLLGNRSSEEKQTDSLNEETKQQTDRLEDAIRESSKEQTEKLSSDLKPEESSKEEALERSKEQKGLFANLAKSITGGFDKFKDSFTKPQSGGIVDDLLGLVGGVSFAVPVLTAIVGSIETLVPKVKPFTSALKLLGIAVFGPIVAVIDFAVGFIKGFMSSEESNFGKKLVDALSGGFAQLISTITLGFVSFDAAQEFLEPFFAPFKTMIDKITNLFGDQEATLFEKIFGMFYYIGEALFDFGQRIGEKIVEFAGVVATYVMEDLGPRLLEMLNSIWTSLVDFITIEVPAYLPVIWESIKTAISFLGSQIVELWTVTIPNFIMELPSKIYSAVTAMGSYLLKVFNYPITIMSEFFSGLRIKLMIGFAKIEKYIAELLNVFGADEEDPDVIAANRKIKALERQQRDLNLQIAERKEQDAQEAAAANAERFARLAERKSDMALGAFVRSLDEDELERFTRERAAQTGQSLESVRAEIRAAEENKYTERMERQAAAQAQINQQNITNITNNSTLDQAQEDAVDRSNSVFSYTPSYATGY